MSDAPTLTGPDFEAGISADSIPDRGFLRGHAFGKPILLSRRADKFFAVSAVCTHYGAPLDDGIQVEDTIHCPWHHASFNLCSGEACTAPALRPLERFRVTAEGGTLRITGSLPDADSHATPAASPASIVIVGNGAAASSAVETLRKEGYSGTITMVGREPGTPVDRPNLSKDYLAGSAPEEWLWLREAEFYQETRITRVEGTITAIDPAAKTITLASGDTLPYGALLLATGADPIVLPLPGHDQPNVFTLRNLADSRAIGAAAQEGKTAVVIGASFIGLEAAASLLARGMKVHVVAPETVPLERILGAEIGTLVRDLHASHGVQFHLGCKPASLEGPITLDDGTQIEADLVVMGVGVRPNTKLAEDAGLTTERGVIVDTHLRTSDPHIWAAGDIARWPDPHTGQLQRSEHWAHAQRQGQIAARNMLGKSEPFTAVPFFWSMHYDTVINWVGFPGGETIDKRTLEDGGQAFAYRKDGRTFAVATIFADKLSLEAEQLLERDDHAALAELIPAS